ncbi:RNA-binding protein [Salipaludibacillus agaradhaerens]|uniref:YlmH family RNA-binding protein n=1 Tax=Salipaludibacillus agaradhaerens TaxID=76935 RepID=UPI00215123A8|nr:RNA-binding protein [Salipaludibacillus agaradhaerens]MCR6107152.1 RNA-binding protein [Salipaludibacillus agaradhaerens]MCR6119182.1 RNA-binding protein [Salipaludibacillus agaradhaerens]
MSLYEHFRKDEHPFVDQVLDWKRIGEEEYRPKLTDFLDPRQQKIVKLIIGDQGTVRLGFWGGHENAERKRALLYPEYIIPNQDDYKTTLFELDYPKKFSTLEHRQLLGSLMSIGMKREKFGDIISDQEHFQLILAKEVADYVRMNLQTVGKTNVMLRELPEENVLPFKQERDERAVTVSSLRLDTVLSEAFHISRAKIKPAVSGEKVKVNWKVVDDPSYQLTEGDMLSLRGKGRCEIVQFDGETKKGKYRLILGFPK